MLNFSDRLKLYKKENCLDVSLGSVSFRVPDPVGSGKNLRHVVVKRTTLWPELPNRN